MMVVVSSERARPPNVAFHELETVTCTSVLPRSVALESLVTDPFGDRVASLQRIAAQAGGRQAVGFDDIIPRFGGEIA
jgi:hypothetical protein